MKVACIGNMNQMMFSLCRYLRDEGIDAHLFCFADEAEHFLPGADSYTEDYRSYTHILPVKRFELLDVPRAEAAACFHGFDFFIGNDYAPALVTYIGKKLDVFIPHGSDISIYPFLTENDQKVSRAWGLKTIKLAADLQKIGVENSTIIIFPKEYEIYDNFRSRLSLKGEMLDASAPMTYIPQYAELDKGDANLAYAAFFKELKAKHGLVVFSHSRHNGFDLDEKMKTHMKGNDIIIKGFAQFARNNAQLNPSLVFFEYGINVPASKKLVEDCGISQYVYWMPKMSRKEILYGIRCSDISCGQFHVSFLTCGVVNETLSLGKPLLHYRNDELYRNDGELYPVLNAATHEDFARQLEYFAANREKVSSEALKGTEWLTNFTVKRTLELVLSKISAKITGSDLPSGLKARVNSIIVLTELKVLAARVMNKVFRTG